MMMMMEAWSRRKEEKQENVDWKRGDKSEDVVVGETRVTTNDEARRDNKSAWRQTEGQGSANTRSRICSQCT